MKRLVILSGLVLLTALMFSGCAGTQSKGGADSLVNLLTKQLGVTPKQATGGVGSTLTLAKERLPGTEFNDLAKFIPESDSFMKSAKDLGAVSGPIGDTAGLKTAYSKLGMGSDMVGKFNEVLSDVVGKAGGEPAKDLLASAFN